MDALHVAAAKLVRAQLITADTVNAGYSLDGKNWEQAMVAERRQP